MTDDWEAEKFTAPRKGMPDPHLSEREFKLRFLRQFQDPIFRPLDAELERVVEAAWDTYRNHRKSPLTQKAGLGYHDPDYDIAVDWLAAKQVIEEAQARYLDPGGPHRILLINGSARSEHTCPGEMSISYRLTQIAKETLEKEANVSVEVPELNRLASEYGRTIHPCKACFSTSPALCHWPCSCYPNYSLGQANDWMNEIYPMWVEAHGIMIVSPVNWYQVSSPIKLMMDRLVCADGGNPDPTLTHGKNAREAKELELEGWDYPRHLEGRLFSVIVHGDVEGASDVRRSLSDWLSYMNLMPAGPLAELDRYIGYWQPYTKVHDALDKDQDVQDEVCNAALTLLHAVEARRNGRRVDPSVGMEEPRRK